MILLAVYRLQAIPPRLDPPVVLPGGSVDLRLRGEMGSNYTIEASANLADWFPVFTGVAGVSGLITARHDAGPNRPGLFYRGREAASTLPPLTIGPQLDPNLTVSTLLTSAGGSTVLYGFGGTRFTFSLPGNSVPEPRILKLTLVTNITGLPFASGMRGAVRIEPDDLAFWGPGTLEITFPPGIDRRYLASFFCNSDGSSFQLTPDRVRTNTITITVTRPGIFGSSVITAQELADAARREIGEGPVPALTATHLPVAVVVECPPGSEALATDMRRRLNAAQSASSKPAAAALAAARQAQLTTAPDDSTAALADSADAICEFYDSHIFTKWGTAIQNCAVGKVVLEFALNANRQRAILGAGDCAGIGEMPLCLIFQKCLSEITDCCQNVTKEAKMVRAVLSMVRGQQLLALDCISREQAQFVIELCSTNAWTGSFSMEGNGFTNRTVTSGGVTTTTIEKYTARFEGTVEESTEDGTLSTGLIIQLKVAGQLNYNTLSSMERSSACSSSLDSTEVVAIGPTEYVVLISTLPDSGGAYTMFAFHVGHGTQMSPVHGTTTYTDYQRSSICDPPAVERNNIRLEPTQAVGAPMPAFQGTMTATNAISGTMSVTDSGSTPSITYKFDWSFKRHEVPQ
jgi:hypothetical protein